VLGTERVSEKPRGLGLTRYFGVIRVSPKPRDSLVGRRSPDPAPVLTAGLLGGRTPRSPRIPGLWSYGQWSVVIPWEGDLRSDGSARSETCAERGVLSCDSRLGPLTKPSEWGIITRQRVLMNISLFVSKFGGAVQVRR
jgi:hypothetical protein